MEHEPLKRRVLTRIGLAGAMANCLVLGQSAMDQDGDPLAELDRALDRSRLLPPTMATPAVLDANGNLKYNDGLEH